MNRRQLAADHLWIARYHARRMAGRVYFASSARGHRYSRADYWELLSVGELALVQAAKSWPGKQAFIPYATTRIVQRISNAIRDSKRNIRTIQVTNRIDGNRDDDELGFHAVEPDVESVYYIRDWIDQLPADEQRAVRMAYGIGTRPRTSGEIAKALRVKPGRSLKVQCEAASEIVRSGILRLRYMATVEQVNG